ncbi:hypothetical protein ABTF88_20050, partial [Acinetobacter baumannii]
FEFCGKTGCIRKNGDYETTRMLLIAGASDQAYSELFQAALVAFTGIERTHIDGLLLLAVKIYSL